MLRGERYRYMLRFFIATRLIEPLYRYVSLPLMPGDVAAAATLPLLRHAAAAFSLYADIILLFSATLPLLRYYAMPPGYDGAP